MKAISYTLVTDGPSDRCLIPIINWVLAQAVPSGSTLLVNSQFADFRGLPEAPHGLLEKIRKASQDFPCDILFVHRDAEREPSARRREEIERAAAEAGVESIVCIIPVRMTEAWLLFDEAAIRRAASNPYGAAQLRLPSLQRIEREPDPKAVLREALEVASEANGRRLQQFRRDLSILVQRVAEHIEDFSPLRRLEAFRDFDSDVRSLLVSQGITGSS